MRVCERDIGSWGYKPQFLRQDVTGKMCHLCVSRISFCNRWELFSFFFFLLFLHFSLLFPKCDGGGGGEWVIYVVAWKGNSWFQR